jgi:Protein of unknown function (DUF1214)
LKGKPTPADPSPDLFACLGGLETAVAQLSNTWGADDPSYRADLYRQTMMNLSYSYFIYFHADAEHPDWAPLWNPVFTCQPNPDDIYLFSPIRSDLTYRVSGSRGTVRKLIFVTQYGIPGTLDDMSKFSDFNSLDDKDFEVGPDGSFEIIFSAQRPAGYAGNWSELKPKADVIYVRYRMVDWARESDPQLAIECLDRVPCKPRLTPQQILERIELMARVPSNMTKFFFKTQNDLKRDFGVNTFQLVRWPGLDKQIYLHAVFELDRGEALIIETDLPKAVEYWNFQLNDSIYNAVEYVYRLGSINSSTVRVSSDGKLRMVIALEDPGVPNWLDPGGYEQGTIYGRWYEADSSPTPVFKRVPLEKLRDYLPADTPAVTAQERTEEIRTRVRAAQRRRRW